MIQATLTFLLLALVALCALPVWFHLIRRPHRDSDRPE